MNEVLNNIEDITLQNMEERINTKRLLLEEYPGAERDLAVVLVQGYYKPMAEKVKPGRSMNALLNRALSYAKWYATKRLTQELHGLVDRSTMYILREAEQTGWYYELEYSNLTEVLASIYEEKQGMDEAYDWKFILEQLVPAAEQAGIPAGKIMEASLQVKKLRSIVPPARELFARQEGETITSTEAQETLQLWLEQVADPDVSYSELKEETDTWRGKSVGRKDPVTGYKVMMPDGHWWVIVPTNGDGELAMMEQALKNRVNFNIRDVGWVAKSVTGMMKEGR